VVELYLIVCEVFATVLTSMIVSPDNAQFHSERNIATAPPPLSGSLRDRLGSKENRADVPKDVALTVLKYLRDRLRIARGVEVGDFFGKCGPTRVI
jgi:hypothetical protein